jgi:hypothetical protein
MKGLMPGALALACLVFAGFCRADSTNDKANFTGQVAVTSSGKKVKMAWAYVSLYSLDVINAAKEKADKLEPALQQSIQPQIAVQKQRYLDDASILEAQLAADGSRGMPDSNNPTLKSKMATEVQDYKSLTVLIYQSIYYRTSYFYTRELPAPAQYIEVKADGKFSLQIPKSGDWVLMAVAEPETSSGGEPYFWCLKLSSDILKKGHVLLNSSNLTTTNNSNNVVNVLDQAKIDAMIANTLK